MPEFIDGLRIKPPHEKAPDFVKCKISIRVSEMQEFLTKQSGEWVNAQIKVSKSGNWYAEVDNWKPDKAKPAFVDDPVPDLGEDVPF